MLVSIDRIIDVDAHDKEPVRDVLLRDDVCPGLAAGLAQRQRDQVVVCLVGLQLGGIRVSGVEEHGHL